MKKLLLTAIVVMACVINVAKAANTPWDKNGNPKWNDGNPTNLYHEYTATKGGVQFEYSWGPEHQNQMWSYERIGANTGWKYENGTFEFTSDYVWTDFNTRLDERKDRYGNIVKLGTIVEYGYYTIGADGQPNDPVMLYRQDAAGNEFENSVIFQKGEKIGIYMTLNETNGNQVTFTSSKSNIEGASAAVPNVDTDSRGDEKQYFCLFDNRKPNTGIGNFSHYEYYFGGLVASDGNYDEFIEQVIKENDGKTNITDSDGNPVSGQPLPGTLATLLIGGLCAGSLRKRNKK